MEDNLVSRGSWEPIRYRFNYLPVHMALLHTGKVLAFGGSGNEPKFLDNPHPAEIWDPENGQPKIVRQKLAGDLFCAGHSFLPDGRLLVTGGTYKYDGVLFGMPIPPFSGLEQSYVFDPASESWTRIGSMENGRWYPTCITVGDGRVVTVAGLTKYLPWAFRSDVEVYSSGLGWSRLHGADRWLPLYPRLHLLPTGEIFYSGSFNTHYAFPFDIKKFPPAKHNLAKNGWDPLPRPQDVHREEGTSVLMPLSPEDCEERRARVLLIGGGPPGGTVGKPDVELMDFRAEKDGWKQMKPMANGRYYVYAVILPDRKVMVVGGSRSKTSHVPAKSQNERTMGQGGHPPGEMPHDPQAVLETELFDPDNETWTTMAPMTVDRLYHSNAFLLPDGRVVAAGSNPMRGENELRIETYRPPYLFKGTRPEIKRAPASIRYGQEFEVELSRGVGEVALMRPSATTHCVDTEQRYVGLKSHEDASSTIVATAPEDGNLAPPGYYMLFVVRDGVPSEARFLKLD